MSSKERLFYAMDLPYFNKTKDWGYLEVNSIGLLNEVMDAYEKMF